MNKTDKIRSLNDAFRHGQDPNGRLVVTSGVAAQGDDFVRRAIQRIIAYTEFTSDNDPYSEHDFGNFELAGERLFFKIDYYDLDGQMHSPDPADPKVTLRVLTVMLACEY